jgi:hypothetical protein
MTQGSSGLILGFFAVLMPLCIALIRHRAHWGAWLAAAAAAAFMEIIGGVVTALAAYLVRPLGVARDGVLMLMIGLAIAGALGYGTGCLMAQAPRRAERHRRGAVVSNRRGEPARRDPGAPGELDPSTPVSIAGLPVAPGDETKHFKFVGTTGTGKSTAIREMLGVALKRGDRAVIADPDGGYLANFHDANRGDVILNPFEAGAVKWNLLGEITTDYDVEQLARSLIPDSGGSDGTWSGYARTFFTAIVQQVIAGGIRDDREVHRLITRAPTAELKVLLAGTAAGPFVEDANERMLGSVRSVTSSAVSALKYTTEQQGTVPFSVRQWIRQGAARQHGGRGGVLWLPYKAGEIAALRSVISAWMRIAIFEAMNRGEGDQRLWFVIDELDALGAIDGLKDALARLRKFGGRCVLGFQSISQVSGTYGRGAADTIVENCGNTCILRCSASEQGGTSQFASRLIGQREIIHVARSRTRPPGEWMASTTLSEQRCVESAVMASEIERLPDLVGFLKFASAPDWMEVALTHVQYPTAERHSAAAPA